MTVVAESNGRQTASLNKEKLSKKGLKHLFACDTIQSEQMFLTERRSYHEKAGEVVHRCRMAGTNGPVGVLFHDGVHLCFGSVVRNGSNSPDRIGIRLLFIIEHMFRSSVLIFPGKTVRILYKITSGYYNEKIPR